MSYQEEKLRNWNPFSIDQWVAWLGATMVGVAGITVFFYVNFETKDAFAEYKSEQIRIQDELFKRLDRIEDKIDRLSK